MPACCLLCRVRRREWGGRSQLKWVCLRPRTPPKCVLSLSSSESSPQRNMPKCTEGASKETPFGALPKMCRVAGASCGFPQVPVRSPRVSGFPPRAVLRSQVSRQVSHGFPGGSRAFSTGFLPFARQNQVCCTARFRAGPRWFHVFFPALPPASFVFRGDDHVPAYQPTNEASFLV